MQFSAPVCAACRTTRRVLAELIDSMPGVAHVEIDAAEHLDLAAGLGISRTPTVLLLDAAGRVHSRIVGAPTRPDVRRALDHLLDERRSP